MYLYVYQYQVYYLTLKTIQFMKAITGKKTAYADERESLRRACRQPMDLDAHSPRA